MRQINLLHSVKPIDKVDWSTYARSLSFDEHQIISWIIKLHNDGQPFDLDPCYSTGRFWQDLPQPKHKFDIAPQSPDVKQADASNLPFDDASIDSIMFDPPFLMNGPSRPNMTGKMERRFSGYPTAAKLWTFYTAALHEFWRILRPHGIVAFKCQDTVSCGKQQLSHVHIINSAEQIGYYAKDIFILGKQKPIWAPNMVNQKHARKTHCYYILFEKVTK